MVIVSKDSGPFKTKICFAKCRAMALNSPGWTDVLFFILVYDVKEMAQRHSVRT